jgi:KDO2-lipid IV(A) lauroyltransferase
VVRSLGESLRFALDRLLLTLARAGIWTLRRFDSDRCSDFFGALARRVGPWVAVNKLGREQLRAAFPERSEAEIEKILAGVWENLGRYIGEFVHLDRLWDWGPLRPDQGRIVVPNFERVVEIRDDNKPGLFFIAHLANWELTGVGPQAHGVSSTVLIRPPKSRVATGIIQELRQESMGRLVLASRTAAFQMARAIQSGSHVGMLMDQFWSGGTRVNFFGRPCPANPTLARLARQFDCEVRGVRVVRLPGHRFMIEITEPLDLPRDAEGKIDVDATTQAITSVIEGWVREHPEQWLWLHRRWREYF